MQVKNDTKQDNAIVVVNFNLISNIWNRKSGKIESRFGSILQNS